MSKEEIISSGILEQYALGGLAESERNQIEKLIATDADVRKELDLIEFTLEKLAFEGAISPKDEVRVNLLNKLTHNNRLQEKNTNVNSSGAKSKTSIVLWQWLSAACFAGFIITGFLAYNLKEKLDETEIRLDIAMQDKRVLADNLQQVEYRLEQSNIGGFNKIELQGTDNAPDASASILWNKQLEEVYFTFQNLPELDKESQYQLWVIKDGKPVDMGVFDYASAEKSLVKMKNTNAAEAFAITIEPKGGSVNPTLEKMVVLGAVENTSKG